MLNLELVRSHETESSEILGKITEKAVVKANVELGYEAVVHGETDGPLLVATVQLNSSGDIPAFKLVDELNDNLLSVDSRNYTVVADTKMTDYDPNTADTTRAEEFLKLSPGLQARLNDRHLERQVKRSLGHLHPVIHRRQRVVNTLGLAHITDYDYTREEIEALNRAGLFVADHVKVLRFGQLFARVAEADQELGRVA